MDVQKRLHRQSDLGIEVFSVQSVLVHNENHQLITKAVLNFLHDTEVILLVASTLLNIHERRRKKQEEKKQIRKRKSIMSPCCYKERET